MTERDDLLLKPIYCPVSGVLSCIHNRVININDYKLVWTTVLFSYVVYVNCIQQNSGKKYRIESNIEPYIRPSTQFSSLTTTVDYKIAARPSISFAYVQQIYERFAVIVEECKIDNRSEVKI